MNTIRTKQQNFKKYKSDLIWILSRIRDSAQMILIFSWKKIAGEISWKCHSLVEDKSS